MRVALLVVYAVLALASAQRVVAQDTDEFDGVEAPTIAIPEDTLSPEGYKYQHVVEQNYWLEGGSWALAIVYLLNYFLGRSQNKSIAEKWLEDSEPILTKEFAYTGASAEPRVGLLEESKSNYKYYCTGRRFCSRLVADLQLANRHDLFSRMWQFVLPSRDYLNLDVGLNAGDLDPFVFSVCKKLQFNNLIKSFPELLSMGKRVENKAIPESFCLATDNIETPKNALTAQFLKHLNVLAPFLEYVVVTDQNALAITGFPYSERRVLRLRLKLQNGSQRLDVKAALAFLTHLVDAIGSTMKLSRDLKASAQKKRAKLQQERVVAGEIDDEQTRRLNAIKEKKREEYEKLSYEEKQKYDELHQTRQFRKRQNRK